MQFKEKLNAMVQRWKALGPIVQTALCAALGVMIALSLVFLTHRYRERNDPWKIEPPAYALQDHRGKRRVFTTLSPAELSNALEKLNRHDLIKWMRARPPKWIAIGGKIDRTEVMADDARYAPQVKIILEQYSGNTVLFFPLAADFRIPKDKGSTIEAVCRIYAFGSHALYLADCEVTH